GVDVLGGLLGREGTDAESQRNPLMELPHLRPRKLRSKLGLADQQNLKEVGGGRLEVREEPDLFERLECEVLGLVENQDRSLTGAVTLDQEGVEGDEALGLRLAGLGDAEVLEDILEQSIEGQRRVEHEGGGGGAIEPAQESAEQGCLPRAHLSGQQNEPDVVLDPVRELSQRVAMAPGEIEKLRIRCRAEGLFAQAVEVEVHARSYAPPRESSQSNCSFPYAMK